MKKIAVSLVILMLAVFSGFAQTTTREQLVLSVKKSSNPNSMEHILKTNRKIKIHTSDDRLIVGKGFTLLEDSIVLVNIIAVKYNDAYTDKSLFEGVTDTIALSEIDWIKGRVNTDAARGIFGGLFMVASVYPALWALYAIAYSSIGYTIVFAIPFVGLLVSGIKMIEPRSFKVSRGWDFSIHAAAGTPPNTVIE